MDFATRLKALVRLAQSTSQAAQAMLAEDQGRALIALNESSEYQTLDESLDILGAIAFRASDAPAVALDAFIRNIESRDLQYPAEYADLMSSHFRSHRSGQTLLCKGLEVLSGLRYLQTRRVTTSLLWASSHPAETVNRAAMTGLKKLAQYDLNVFSGNERQPGIGPRPQLEIVEVLASISDSSLLNSLEGVLALITGMLATAMERAVWSSEQVTLYRGTTPATEDVAKIRAGCIDLLRRLYRLSADPTSQRSIVATLTSATRPDRAAVVDESYASMISENARSVLAFFCEAASSADLQTIQKIEHNSYWIFHHTARSEIREAALLVKETIDRNHEYTIYKTLVGFEGVFGDWEEAARDRMHGEASREERLARATQFAVEITPDTFEAWRKRILAFAATRSNDLATFPIFFQFLEEVAKAQPTLALTLLTTDIDAISNFAIPLLRGLWDGAAHSEARSLMRSWVQNSTAEDDQLLRASARMFLSATEVDFDAIELIFAKAKELKAKDVLDQVTAVAVARFSSGDNGEKLRKLFLECLRLLTELRDASWVHSVWYHQEAKSLVSDFDASERAVVLENLKLLPSIDYQAEEILGQLAEVAPGDVIRFFCARAEHEGREGLKRPFGEFEAIPYDFHSLQEPLSKHPREAVAIVLASYKADSSLFQFRGGKLLQDIFPRFNEEFQRELVRLVDEGHEKELEFVVGVLRAYEGEPFLNPVYKAVAGRLPSASPLLQSLTAAMLSTGVVMGEFGMAEAYEQKLADVSSWLNDDNENTRAFARSLTANVGAMIQQERRRAEESISLRKFRFGET